MELKSIWYAVVSCLFLHPVKSSAQVNRGLEILAVLLNLLYTVFYLNGNSICYLFGVLGPLALIVLCYRNKLFAEPLLQMVYIVFAFYGYYHVSEVWQHKSWPFSNHIVAIIVGSIVSMIAGFLLSKHTSAKLPYADSVITVFAIIGTWLMVNYVHESWLYLMAINFLSVIVYMLRKLYVGAAMYLLYFVMSVDGYFTLNWFVI